MKYEKILKKLSGTKISSDFNKTGKMTGEE